VSGVARQTSTVLPPFFTLVVVYSTFAGKVWVNFLLGKKKKEKKR
jgi:hypothetical protein